MSRVLRLQHLQVTHDDEEIVVQSDISDHCSGVIPSTDSDHCTSDM